MNFNYQPKLLSILREGYTKSMLLKDILAGIIVGIIALPLSIAFAIASGARPEQGILTAILAGIIAGGLSGSRFQISGPTGAFVVLVFGTIEKFGYEGLLASTFIAGILLLLMGIFRFGKAMMFVPYPVIVGFTSGIALFIFSSQVHDFLGLGVECKSSPDCISLWKNYLTHLDVINPWSVLLGLVSILFTVNTAKWIKHVPGALVAIIVTTALVYFFSIPVDTIGTRYGTIKVALPDFSFPDFSKLHLYVTPAIGIALLAGIESLLSAAVADGMTGRRHRSDEELISQGFANIGSAVIGGLPVTGAIARTAANIRSGAVSPVASIVHSLTLLCMILLIGQLVALIPISALSGILIVVAYNMSEWRHFVKLFKSPKVDIAILLTTFLLTVFVDLVTAIEAGIILAGMLFIKKIAETTKAKDIKSAFSEEEIPKELEMLKNVPKDIEIFEIYGPLFFGAAEQFKTTLLGIQTKPRALILRMRNVQHIDASGIRALEYILENTKKEGTVLILSGVNNELKKTLEQSKFIDSLGKENIQPDINHALKRAKEL